MQKLNDELVATFDEAAPAPDGTVCMFVRNTFEHDARVIREIEALTDQGLAVVVVASAPTAEAVGVVEEERYTLVRVFHQATSVRLLLDWMLEFQRSYWRRSRSTWKVAKWPFRPTGLFLANKVARPLAMTKNPRMSPATRQGLVRSLRTASRGFLRVAALRSGRPPMGIAIIKRVRTRIQRILWPIHRLLAAGYFVRLCARVGSSLEPTVYHCHDQNTVLAGQLARWRSPAHVIYDAHELYPHRNRPNPSRWKTSLFELGDRYSARRSDAVITVNESIARHIAQRYDIDRVDVVMNIPEVGGRTHDDDAEVLDLSHIPRPRLFYCGNITFNRGLEEAVVSLVDLPECSLVVVGQARGTYADDLRSQAAALGVDQRLHIFPPVPHEEVVRVASQADIGLVMIKPSCLSYEYALPNKLFECLHAGLPMVASDLPELRRIVLDEGVGLVCDHDDPSSIADAVKTIIGSPELAEKMRRCATAAAETYTWDRERQHLLDVYRRLGLLDAAVPAAAGTARTAPAPSRARRSLMPSKVTTPGDERPAFPEDQEPKNAPESAKPESESEQKQRKLTRAQREVLRNASRKHLHAAITQHLPEGTRVAVVSRGDDELLDLRGYELGHFPQASDGGWVGYHPGDDEAAIAELAEAVRTGYEFLAFPPVSHWWLDHYLGLRAHLEVEAEVVFAVGECTIFRVGRNGEVAED